MVFEAIRTNRFPSMKHSKSPGGDLAAVPVVQTEIIVCLIKFDPRRQVLDRTVD